MNQNQNQNQQIARLKEALTQVRHNKGVFSAQAYSQIVMTLLEKLRQLQTITPEALNTADEIRLVTVMFVDIKDSTELAQRLETGDWKALIAGAHRRMTEIIRRWDGQVGQYLGDGLLCFFGARHSRGDDALRAVSCALAIQAVSKAYAAEIEEVSRQHDFEFAVRIGISTGRVVVGMIGSADKREMLALGPATNLAARLQALAPPGHIYIDSHTHGRVRNHFTMTTIPPMVVKGFDEPVDIYEVVERRAQPDMQFTDTTLAGIHMPFVGRADEMRHLITVWESSKQRQGFRSGVVLGDIGLGKSRLLQEVALRFSEQPYTLVSMIARYERRNTPYNLLHDWLVTRCNLSDDTPADIARQRITETLIRLTPDPDAPQLAAVLGYLAGYGFDEVPEVAAIQRGGPDQEAMALAWVMRWFRALAEVGPLLVVVDNLQWADPMSLEMLQALPHHLDERACLLLVAGRSEVRGLFPAFFEQLQPTETLTLDALPPEATATLIDTVLSRVTRVPGSLAAMINQRAQGNPLFVQEFLAMLFDNGVFQPDGHQHWKFNLILYDSAVATLPDGLTEVLQARLDDLSPEARHIIQVAATVGQIFWSGVVSEIADINALPLLDHLEMRGMILRHAESGFEGETQYAFRHTLYRDVAYEMIPRAKRRSYHEQVANWLVTRIAEKVEFFTLLAEQFEYAERYDAALFTYLEAVQSRFSGGLMDDTVSLIDRGLALARNVPREVALPVVAQFWTIRSQALNTLYRFDEASAASQSALMLLDELPADQLAHMRIEAARMLGQAYKSLGRYEAASKALHQAFEMLPKNNPSLYAAVLRIIGSLALVQGRLGDSLTYQQRAFTFAQATRQLPAMSGSMVELGQIAYHRGDFATALLYFERVRGINLERGARHYQANDLRHIGMVYDSLYLYDWALEAYDEAEAILRQLSMSDNLLQMYLGLCWLRAAPHHEGEGWRLVQDAVEHSHPDYYSARLIELAHLEVLHLLGAHERCHEQARAFVQKVADNPLLTARGLRWAGLSAHYSGESEAVPLLEQALAQELDVGGRDAWRCYHALGLAVADAQRRYDYQVMAAQTVKAISLSLKGHEAVQRAFLATPQVRKILGAVERG